MLTALEILTAFIKTSADTDDIDRLVAMSAYMAKKLEQDMLKPIEQLEAEVWPELVTTGSEAHDSI
jgi:hypothetical protein